MLKPYFRFFLEAFNDLGKWKVHLAFLAWAGILLYLNFGLDLEKSVFQSIKTNHYGRWANFSYYFSIQFFPFLLCPGLLYLKNHQKNLGPVLVLAFIGSLVLAFDRSFILHYSWAREYTYPLSRFLGQCLEELKSWIIMVLPLGLIWLGMKSWKKDGFLGVRIKNVNLKLYWILLAGMLPLVFFASFSSGFQSAYPRFNDSLIQQVSQAYQINSVWPILTYEILYLADFFTVELFFRGFLILGISHFIGPQVIMPMAASYCALHFGKPFGEALSSVFGGYILGVLAYYTRNIWGGVFIHMGIAGLMEIFAFFQILIQKD